MPADLDIRPASTSDLHQYVRLRDANAERMLADGIEQWRPGELDAERITRWVGDGEIFVARLGDQLIGGLLVMWSDPLFWGDEDGAAGYTHGLLVDRRHKGRRLGRRLLAFAEDRIRARGRRLARLDTVSTNTVLRAYYRDAGYAEVGERVFDDGVPVPAVTLFEKPL